MKKLRKRYGSAAREKTLETVLANLLEYVTSGRRYETRNPYTIPEVQAAQRVLHEWGKR